MASGVRLAGDGRLFEFQFDGEQGPMLRRRNEPPAIPRDCQSCPIREATVCRALADGLDVLQAFKLGDRILPTHSHLYRPGDKPAELYNLLDGWIALYRILEDGTRQVLQVVLPGAFIGYQPSLEEPMAHGAECITDVSVCVFPRKAFPDLLEKYPAVAHRVVWLVAHDLMEAQDHLTNVGGRPATERVAHFLLQIYLRMRQDHPANREDMLELPLTQELIADALGMTPVYVNRILRQLRERGLVMLRNRTLWIMDFEGLRRLAEIPPLDAVEP
ncbi:MAG: Crp/Fnr family transcriptional regulator [Pseudomonadota bacterium]